MRILLDTHTFLWMDDEQSKLSPAAKAAILMSENEIYLSVVSLWEIVIKVMSGKLTTVKPLRDIVQEQEHENGIRILPVTLPHVLAVERLPDIHKDPFDRLLIAQAIADDMTIATADHLFVDYPVRTLW